MRPLDAVPAPRRRSTAFTRGAVGLFLALSLYFVAGQPPERQAPAVQVVVVVLLVVQLGWVVRRARRDRRSYEQALTQRAADLAVASERLRIARDLHDIVSHALGVVSVRAAAGRRLAVARPEEALAALDDVEVVSREATAELRRMLAVLRRDTDEPELTPTPSLQDVDALIGRARSAGLDVELLRQHAEDVATGVPPGVQLAAYRIVQEALTNVVRHVGPTRVQVRLSVSGQALEVVVRNEATLGAPPREPVPPVSMGSGLLGMRERVAAFGGTVCADPLPDSGFEVRATLPYPANA